MIMVYLKNFQNWLALPKIYLYDIFLVHKYIVMLSVNLFLFRH